ncbi:hypothetical protein OG288_15795 [Streptomyces tauricus]|uniref:Uncharacterized protein n=1 Tax=Streptomyces tauricus TaxID=68274 RepID=A0ABZ1JIQ5_9ACTN|nr:hypothetical protein [Streptomyces tauricus]
MTTIKAIETHYAGCRFRSRLEARWAVFFDAMEIRWEYEPEGYVLSDRTYYLPDFLLPDSGTWIEVKGSEENLDMRLLNLASRELPVIKARHEQGPRLMLLGTIPTPLHDRTHLGFIEGDYGWISWHPENGTAYPYGFGSYHKNLRPWMHCTGDETGPSLLHPTLDDAEDGSLSMPAYRKARSARFEHGECG